MSIDTSLMGEFQIPTWKERQFTACWYAIAEVWANVLQAQEKVTWNGRDKHKALQAHMETMFGGAYTPKVSVDELVQFSIKHFNVDFDGLILINKESFKRRQQYKNNNFKKSA